MDREGREGEKTRWEFSLDICDLLNKVIILKNSVLVDLAIPVVTVVTASTV